MTLMFHFVPMKIQFTSHSNDILSHIQRGFDECMHLIFNGCSSRDDLAFTAMLNCRSLTAPERHINAWAIFGQHIASSTVIPNSFTSRFLLYSCMSTETKGGLPSHSKILRNFFNDPIRARSLLITEETYMAAATACFEYLESTARCVCSNQKQILIGSCDQGVVKQAHFKASLLCSTYLSSWINQGPRQN